MKTLIIVMILFLSLSLFFHFFVPYYSNKKCNEFKGVQMKTWKGYECRNPNNLTEKIDWAK